MALRMINRNIVRFNELIYAVQKSNYRCLHSTLNVCKDIQFCLADIGEGIREVTVKSWHVKPEDRVSQFDNICDVESDKATVTITSRYDGVIKKLYYNVDDVALVGKPLVDIDVPDKVETEPSVTKTEPSVTKTKPSVTVSSVAVSSETIDKSLATPAVRRIAAEHNISLNDVKATGKNRRVLKEDILSHLGQIESPVSNSSKTRVVSNSSRTRVEPITGFMKTMVKTMTESNAIPALGYVDTVDFTRLIELKSRLLEKTGVKMTFLPIIVKAVSKGLLKHPILNASPDKDCKNIIYKSYHNIGIAVDSPNGLLVPNIKNVEQLTITEISNEIIRLQKAAFENKLTPNEMSDGTFTITNIGAIGGTLGLPCILPPEVCILAIGRVEKVPVYNKDNQIVPANLGTFSYSADHRVIQGASVSRFSTLIKDYLENPELLLIDY